MPLSRGELGPPLTCGLGRGLLLYQVASSSMQPFGHNRHGPKIGGCASFRVAGSPSNTTSPGPRPTFIPSGIFVNPAVWPQRTFAENWGAVPFLGGSWVPSNTKAGAEAYLHTKWHLSPSSRLPTTDMGRKLGAVSLGHDELDPHLTQCRLG